jgi:hypothetical protein
LGSDSFAEGEVAFPANKTEVKNVESFTGHIFFGELKRTEKAKESAALNRSADKFL